MFSLKFIEYAALECRVLHNAIVEYIHAYMYALY